jgi:hypothetical protein
VQLVGRAQLTGSEGEFSFAAVPAGWTQVSVVKPGFFMPGNTEGWAPSPVEVGPDTGKILLKLAPEAVIFGRVTSSEDEPLEGAEIRVLRYVSRNGRKRLESQGTRSLSTDEDGNFHMGGLPAGGYYVEAKTGSIFQRIPVAKGEGAKQGYPPLIYYPGTQDLAAAETVEVSPGQRVEASFSLSLLPAFRVAGTVAIAGEWKQVAAPIIVDAMERPIFWAAQFNRETGAFEFRSVPAGTYTLRIFGVDQQDHAIYSDRTITVSQNVTDLKLSLKPRAIIPVRIHTEFDQRVEGGSCATTISGQPGVVHRSDCSDYPAASVELVPVNPSRSTFAPLWGPSPDPSTLEIYGVAPGRYRAHAYIVRHGYIHSLRSGAVDLFHEELVVPEEGSVPPIEMVLRDDSASLIVQVHRQKPGPASVLLVGDGGVVGPNVIGPTNSEMQAWGLAPGTYKVLAFTDLQGLDYADPEVLARYLDRATSVTLSAHNSATILVEVIAIGE